MDFFSEILKSARFESAPRYSILIFSYLQSGIVAQKSK